MRRFLAIYVVLSALILSQTADAAVPVSDTAGSEEARFREKQKESQLTENAPEPAAIQEPSESAASPSTPPSSMKVLVKDVHFLGNYSVSDAQLKPFFKELIGREASLDELQDAVSRVKKYYREHGFVATYAYVPPQQMTDGVIKVDVIEGRLGELRIEGNRFYNSEALRKKISLKSADILTYDALRRDLNRLNQMEDISAKLALEAGKDVGTADAVIQIEDRQPIHASLEANNSGTKNTGLYRFGASASDNNLTGHTDRLSTSVQLGDGTSAGGIGYEFPWLDTQTRVGYSFTEAVVDIGGAFEVLGAEGEAETHSIYATHPLWANQSASVDGTAALDFKDVKNRLLNQAAGEDQLRILRLEADIQQSAGGTKTIVTPGLYFGLTGILGGSDSKDPDMIRAGSDAQFFAFRTQGIHYHQLPAEMLLSLRGSVQYSPDSLAPSEQFRLGGARSVRGYSESDSMTDYGAQGSVELFCPLWGVPQDWRVPLFNFYPRKGVQTILFADLGAGTLQSPGPGESEHRTLAGVGAGFRAHLYDKIYARLEWGFPVAGNEPADHRSSAYYFTLSYELM